jgi:hypothetical protein
MVTLLLFIIALAVLPLALCVAWIALRIFAFIAGIVLLFGSAAALIGTLVYLVCMS